LVIQLDPPLEYKTYLHRSGRTGRGGKTGTVLTMIHRSKRRRLEDLLHRAERDGIFSDVRPSSELLEDLAGPIAAPPAVDILDFGSRGRDSSDRGGRSGGRGGDRPRSGGNYGGKGKGRWADRQAGEARPRNKSRFND
jgi:superfamily II DNA/RNA helicase